jgi:hypothetical protein
MMTGDKSGATEAVQLHGSGEQKDAPEFNGPLSARINDISDNIEERVFTAATFIFAGHDTTANTMVRMRVFIH